jgi:hypothetical protein
VSGEIAEAEMKKAQAKIQLEGGRVCYFNFDEIPFVVTMEYTRDVSHRRRTEGMHVD